MTMPVPVREETLSIEEAAKELGLSVKTIYNRIHLRQIGSFNTGRVRIPMSEIIRVKRKRWRLPVETHRAESGVKSYWAGRTP